MKKKKYILVVFSVFVFFWSCKKAEVESEIRFDIPKNFPQPHYDLSQNPINRAGFELGRKLFYDPLLSRDGSTSCGSCHQQSAAFTHPGHDLSHGIDDRLTMRNALPIQNLAWEEMFFWDGGVFHLDLFAPNPIENPNEMDEKVSNVLVKLRKDAVYPLLFEKAFGSKEITTERFLKALSQFQLMCISANSQYDKFVRNEGVSLSAIELAGLQIFKEKCSTCHAGELFTDHKFRNNGLKINNADDTGRERITLNAQDKYLFKVPSLRNIGQTAPYMHDGRFRSLDGVLNHYSEGVQDLSTLDSLLKKNGTRGIPLTTDEKEKLKAFLMTLSDTEFTHNPLLSEQ